MQRTQGTSTYAFWLLVWLLGPCSGGGSGDGGGGTPTGGSAAIEMLAPAGDATVRPGTSVEIRYVPHGPAGVDILADADGDLGTTDEQVVIAADRPAVAGVEESLTWNTSGATAGRTYRLFARDSDGPDAAAAPGRVTVNAAPAVTILQPSGDAEVSAGDMVAVWFVADDPDDVAATAVYADRDGNLATAGDRIVLESARPEANGTAQQTTWNTAQVAAGTYSILGVCSDGLGDSAVARAPGRLTVLRGESVSDDFEDGVIDASLWDVSTPFLGSSARETGGRLEMSTRPYVASVDEWRPTAATPLVVDLSFLVTSESNELNVVTRSDGQWQGAFAEPSNGIVVDFSADSDLVRIVQVVGGGAGPAQNASFAFAANTVYRVRIVDDGDLVRVFVNDMNDSVVEAVRSTTFPENRVVFTNHEFPFGITALTEVTITGARNS